MTCPSSSSRNKENQSKTPLFQASKPNGNNTKHGIPFCTKMCEFEQDSKNVEEQLSHSLTVTSNELLRASTWQEDEREAVLSFTKYSSKICDYVRNTWGAFWVKRKNQSMPHLLFGCFFTCVSLAKPRWCWYSKTGCSHSRLGARAASIFCTHLSPYTHSILVLRDPLEAGESLPPCTCHTSLGVVVEENWNSN